MEEHYFHIRVINIEWKQFTLHTMRNCLMGAMPTYVDVFKKARGLIFKLSLHLHLFVYASSKGYDDSMYICRLTYVSIACQCDEIQNPFLAESLISVYEQDTFSAA